MFKLFGSNTPSTTGQTKKPSSNLMGDAMIGLIQCKIALVEGTQNKTVPAAKPAEKNTLDK